MTDQHQNLSFDLKQKKVTIPYVDAVNADESTLQELLKSNIPIKFDWSNKWLKGDEYSHILSNMEAYCKAFNLQKFSQKTHPECIYVQPENGMLYFVRGNTIGSDFGFPRLGIKKKFKWKKMNFTTDLPKRDPIVSYIVASAVKCEKFFPGCSKEGPVFRMHAVILTKKPNLKGSLEGHSKKSVGSQKSSGFGVSQNHGRSSNGSKWIPAQNATNFILCHVRKVVFKKSQSDEEAQQIQDESIQSFEQEASNSQSSNRQQNLEDALNMEETSLKDQNNLISKLASQGQKQSDLDIKNSYFNTQKQVRALRRKRAQTDDNLKFPSRSLVDNSSQISKLSSSHNQSLEIQDDDSDFIINESQKQLRKRQLKEATKEQSKTSTNLLKDSTMFSLNQLNKNKFNLNQRKLSYQPQNSYLYDQEIKKDAELVANLIMLQKRQKRSESLDYSSTGKSQSILQNQPMSAKALIKSGSTQDSYQYCLDRIKKNTILVNNLSRKSSDLPDDLTKPRSAFSQVNNFINGNPHVSPATLSASIPFFSPFANFNRTLTDLGASSCFSDQTENLKLKSQILRNLAPQTAPLYEKQQSNQFMSLQNGSSIIEINSSTTQSMSRSLQASPNIPQCPTSDVQVLSQQGVYINMFNTLYSMALQQDQQQRSLQMQSQQQFI